MDHLLNILVKIFVFLSRFAPFFSKLGLLTYRRYGEEEADQRLHILLVGYTGARNTGSDVRVAETARQILERMGKDRVALSVLTLDAASMQSYFDDSVTLIQIRSIFLPGVFKACSENQAAVLCEGSTLKSQFANALTFYLCEAAGIMKTQHKPCIAYGSEAGEMDAFLEKTAQKLCRETYFITRSQHSLDRIHDLGLSGQLGTDTAWNFDSEAYTDWAVAQLKRDGWDGHTPLLGIAPINPFWWPVKPSLFQWVRAGVTGNHTRQFQLWYFFSWSRQREYQFDRYLDAIADSVNAYTLCHDCQVVILGMERLDADACRQLGARLDKPSFTILSANHDGHRMAAILRQLSLLITSRYHAQVLSMAKSVPSVAISMDERLDNLMQEMGLDAHQLLSADDPELSSKLASALTYVTDHQAAIKESMDAQRRKDQQQLDRMGDFLSNWLES